MYVIQLGLGKGLISIAFFTDPGLGNCYYFYNITVIAVILTVIAGKFHSDITV